MAASLDALLGTANQQAATNCVLATTNAVAVGGRICVMCGAFTVNASGTMSGGGLTWINDARRKSGSLLGELWHADAPSGLLASTNLTWGLSGSSNDMMILAGSFLGLDPAVTAATGFNSTAASTQAFSSGAVGASAGDFIFGGAFCDGLVGTITSWTSGTELQQFSASAQSETEGAAYLLSSAGASDVISGNWSAAVSHIALGASYAVAATGSPPPIMTQYVSAMNAMKPVRSYF